MSRRAAGRPKASEGEHVWVRPLPTGGDFAAFWRQSGARVAKLGLRGGFVHPVTGRTLGDAVATALLLTRQRDFSGGALHDLFEAEAKQAWKKRELLRAVDRRARRAPGRRSGAACSPGSTASRPARSPGFHADRLGLDRPDARAAGAQGPLRLVSLDIQFIAHSVAFM